MDAAATSRPNEGRGDAPALVVYRLSTAQLVLAPIRLALGLALLPAASAAGASGGAAAAAFAAGAFGLAFAALADPRRRFLGVDAEPEPLPAGAVAETRLQLARTRIFPSTVGVAALTLVASGVGQGVLAALLAGGLAGMAAAAAIAGGTLLARERGRRTALLADRRGRRLFEAPF